MAGEIFVGSVAVGVVPDLRGFNTKVRAELVPAANSIGREIGKEIVKGIMDSLDMGDIVTKATAKSFASVRRDGYALGLAYGQSMRKGIELSLEGIKANVKVDIDAASLTKARLDIEKMLSNLGSGGRGGGGITRIIRGATGGGDGGGGQQGPLDVALQRGFGSFLGGQQIAGITQLFAALPPQVQGAIGIGVAASLPFIAQAIGGAVVTGLGGALTGLGIAGALVGDTQAQIQSASSKVTSAQLRVAAAQDRLNQLRTSGKATAGQLASAEASLLTAQNSVATSQLNLSNMVADTKGQEKAKAAWQSLSQEAEVDLGKIGASFAPVLTRVFGFAQSMLDKITPVFAGAEKILSGPFERFADAIIKSFGDPQVLSSVTAIAKAFGGILDAFTPDIPGIVNSLADAIERIANAIAKNPKAFADFANFLFQIVIAVLNGIAFLTDFADYIESHFWPVMHRISELFDSLRHDIAHIWDLIWQNTIDSIIKGAHEVAVLFDGFRHEIAHVWDDIYQDTIGKIIRTFDAVKNYITTNFDKWWATNGDAIKQIWASIWTNLGAIFKTFFGPIILAVRFAWRELTGLFSIGSGDIAAIWHIAWQLISSTVMMAVNFVILDIRTLWNIIKNLFDLGAGIIRGVWNIAWGAIRGEVRIAWAAIQAIVKIGWDVIVGLFGIFINLITFHWRSAWTDLKNMATQIWNAIKNFAGVFLSSMLGIFSNTLHNIEGIWSTTFTHIKNIIISIKNFIVTFFADAIHWLEKAGGDIISGLYNGITNEMKGIANWVNNNVVQPVIHWVEHFFGIKSPSTVMAGLGSNIVKGLMAGIFTSGKDLTHFLVNVFGGIPQALGKFIEKGLVDVTKIPGKVLAKLGSVFKSIGGFFAKAFGGGTSGTSQWAGTVIQALAMLGLPPSLLGNVLYQMQTESGGNVNAINLTDINAQRGDPSRGLMQVIGSTFAAYHVPGTSSNIYDPLANIAAALNYAMHVYGPTLMRGGMGVGSGHGYAAGTGGAAAGWAWVGEAGPELVLFSGGETVVPNTGRGYATGVGPTAAQIISNDAKYIGTSNATHAAAVAKAHANHIAALNRAHARHIAALAAAAARHAAAIVRATQNAGATVAAEYAKITTKTTATTLLNDQTRYLKDIRLYFTPSVAAQRSRLVINQTKQLEGIQAQLKTVGDNIKAAQALQTTVYQSLLKFGGIAQTPLYGTGAAAGASLLSGLRIQATTLKNFGNAIRDITRVGGVPRSILENIAQMAPDAGTAYARGLISAIRKLRGIKAPSSIINQLIAAGPEVANAYADALIAAGPTTRREIYAAQASIDAARLGVSRGVASAVYGGGYNTGANFVAGLQKQQKTLEAMFAHLGKVMAQEAIKWFGVPSKQRPYGYQHGGWLNEPVSGYGLYSGHLYTFAEQGREYVVPEGGFTPRGGDGSNTYVAHFDSLTGAAIESHVRMAYQAMAITQGNLNRQGRRR